MLASMRMVVVGLAAALGVTTGSLVSAGDAPCARAPAPCAAPKMVERTIGAKIGTGGSEGAQYLRTTLMQPIFPDLWAIRSQL